jgi:hypothetical protein
MQGIRLDPNTWKTPNGRQLAEKRVATSRPLRPLNGPLETGAHLCLGCPFAKAVWNQILAWEHFDGLLGQQQADPIQITPWWEETTRKAPKAERRRFNGIVIYTFWTSGKKGTYNLQQHGRNSMAGSGES